MAGCWWLVGVTAVHLLMTSLMAALVPAMSKGMSDWGRFLAQFALASAEPPSSGDTLDMIRVPRKTHVSLKNISTL